MAAALERKFTPPPGAALRPIDQNILNTMQAQQAPQNKSQGMFVSGAPIRPTPGITPLQGPRSWQYPVGYNIGRLPRSTELTPFDTLRNLSNLYDGIGLCERVWFDLCSKVEMAIKPKTGVLQPGEDDTKFQPIIQKYLAFFKKPDRKTTLKAWMRKALKDILEIDALAIFKHKSKGGGLYGLEIIDGTLIKPLVDERGMEPNPPFPAYQQFVYGVPGALLTRDELIYRRETDRSDSPYGISRVERIITRINQALRKQNRDLATFTDGNAPAGMMEPPADGSIWTPDDLVEWQTVWDGLLAGNDALRSRLKVVPPGWKYNKTEPDDIMTPFDTFLLNTTVAAFGLTMAELAFTENVNKSSGDTQEAIIYRRAMAPIMSLFAEIFTEIIEVDFNDNRFMVTWTGYEEPEDFKSKVDAWDTLVKNGTQSTSQAAHALGLKPLVETGPYILAGKDITWVEDAADPKLRKAKQDAALAGYQLAQQSPGAVGPDGQPKKESSFSTEKKPGNQEQGKPGQKEEGEEEESNQPKKPPVKRAAEADLLMSKQGTCDCPTCRANDGKSIVSIGGKPPYHDGCDCAALPPGNTGIMLAFMLDGDTAQQLALPGGEPVENLHVTLAYLGDLAEGLPEEKLNPALTLEHISTVVASYARMAQPFSGRIGGLGRFINPERAATPVYASVQAPGLQAFQRKLVEAVEQAGYWTAHDFDYTPHITLAYIEPGAEMPIDSVPILPLTFDTICLAIGDDQYFFPIGPQEEKSLDQARELNAELRRWRTRAVEDVRRFKRPRGFTTTIIPEHLHMAISHCLERCLSVEDVRATFEQVRSGALDTGSWQALDDQIQRQVAEWKAQGYTHYRWGGARVSACNSCLRNAGKTVKLGEPFPSGAYIVPNHNHCECGGEPIKQ